ncbi:Putative CoA-transferase subunit beta [Rhodococcus sp. WAY2]|nr:Putative CoA-transferase subunit beta [Rhodococcus sp. WAY2]
MGKHSSRVFCDTVDIVSGVGRPHTGMTRRIHLARYATQ